MAENQEKRIEDQAREQTGQQQVRLRLDETKMTTCYANALDVQKEAAATP